ncbi:MAG: NAD-dependent protein deacetylase [Steroidobacteraceae bacterium]
MLAVMEVQALSHFIQRHQRLFVLTGAGCSTASGIPDYRDAGGNWKRDARPVTLQAFMADEHTRRRYWARSVIGWQRISRARPNAAHLALARLQLQGRVELLVTQNVDGLHQAAGSTAVIDLHGRLDGVCCMSCQRRSSREQLQTELLRCNPDWIGDQGRQAPDGDADLDAAPPGDFRVVACSGCGGVLKPDVVYFGENVPPARVQAAMRHLTHADAMLIVGSSLMVYSGYRFVRAAAELGLPIAAVNLGRTRADELLALKLAQPCASALAFLLAPEPRAA